MKRFLAMLIVALTIVGTSFGEEETVNGVTYRYFIENGGATIIGDDIRLQPAISSDTSGELIIPSELGGYPVKTIGKSAFVWCKSLTSVKIPDSVTTIGHNAFWFCESLTSIKIPENVTTINGGAFAACGSLAWVQLPKSIMTIEMAAFADCHSLRDIYVQPGDYSRVRHMLKDSRAMTDEGWSQVSIHDPDAGLLPGMQIIVSIIFILCVVVVVVILVSVLRSKHGARIAPI